MSIFKNNPNFILYYSDTDSIFVVFKSDNTLTDMIGAGIGKLKLEYNIKEAVFLAPKVYAFITEDGREIIKVKGVTQDTRSDINFSMVEDLLVKDSSKEFSQEKWFKKTLEGDITIDQVAYTLRVTSNKRMPLYLNYNGKDIFNGTKPYNYTDIIDNNNNSKTS